MKQKKHTTSWQAFLVVALAIVTVAIPALAQLTTKSSVVAVASNPVTVGMISSSASSEVSINMGSAIDERKAMLERTVHVSFLPKLGEVPLASFDLSLKNYPLWITFDVQGKNSKAVIDVQRVKQYLISYPPQGIPEPQSCVLLSSWTDEQGVLRAQTDCIAKSGFVYDKNVLSDQIKNAFEKGEEKVEYLLKPVAAVITDPASGSDKPMKLLANGQSNFQGSGLARKSNVRKGLNERVHNVLIPTGAVFSFNDTLGIVSVNRGWLMALTIFEGVNLRPAPGGGICQVSTTIFRAALAAGLPILEQKNHSLYVAYYEKFGVGQDATIFPGKQDMKFLNDTGSPLLIQAYNQGDDAFVRMYGSEDERTVTLSGPYFSKTAPKDLLENGKTLKNNDIGWVRTVSVPGSEIQRQVFVARYKAIPKSLPTRSELKTVTTRGEVTKSFVAAQH